MRISTTQIYTRGLNNILNQQRLTSRIQQQIATGKRVMSPSDDPVSAARIDLMRHRIDVTERFQINKDAAINQLSLEENVLSNVISNLQQVRELQVRVGNEALSDNDRKMIGQEVSSLLTELEGLANTRDVNGRYLFSGGKTLAKAFTKNASGNYIYNGDSTIRQLDISSGIRIKLNDSGSDIFMRIPNGNGRFTVSDPLPANTGSIRSSVGNIIDESSYVEDNYTISFVQNTAGDMVVMVSGATSGNVIPPSGLADDAPVYQEGQDFNFNGISLSLKGQPAVGDNLSVQPSINESIFSTVQSIAKNMNSSSNTDGDKARILSENGRLLSQVDSAIENILIVQSEIGSRLKLADVAHEVNEDFILSSQEALSALENLDLAEAAVNLNSQTILLQASQQSFTRIQGLSLFNFL